MTQSILCTLCGSLANFYARFRDIGYYKCSKCQSVMMDPGSYLSSEKEKYRYDQHNNDVNDSGYRNFVKPLVEAVKHYYSPEDSGLDYGAGPGPVTAVILGEQGYSIELYDPFYHPAQKVLNLKYDYIICCEVIEHFKKPAEEFAQLRFLLKENGSIFCMTEMFDDNLDFMSWHYKNDPTHLFFYHEKAISWIKENYCFKEAKIRGRLIHLLV